MPCRDGFASVLLRAEKLLLLRYDSLPYICTVCVVMPCRDGFASVLLRAEKLLLLRYGVLPTILLVDQTLFILSFKPIWG